MHLENLEKILTFIVQETSANTMIIMLSRKINLMVERYIILRDIENFIAYFKVLLSSSRVPKKLLFERALIEAFIERSYGSLMSPTQEYRIDRLYVYMNEKLGEGTEITNEKLELLEESLRILRNPSLEKIMEHTRIATILKWLQGPLKEQLSEALKDYIVFLATVYGQYKRNLVFNVEWEPFSIAQKDMTVLTREYRIFEIALLEALQAVRDAQTGNSAPDTYEKQFQIVFTSLDNLVKMAEAGTLDSFDSFKHKIIISTALIYIQDDFVEKDAELKKLIQLFVSLYYQFRDQRPTAYQR
jgi:hypothetical protein